jgi:L-arabinonolactonase
MNSSVLSHIAEPLIAELEVDCRNSLGEGILWNDSAQCALWTDITRSRLWRWHPETRALRYWRLPDQLASFAFCSSGKLLLAFAKGLYFADLERDSDFDGLTVEFVATVEPLYPNLRCNDGRVDRSGNFVFGTLNKDPARAALGSFYQFSTHHGIRKLNLGGVAIPNSICFDLDGSGIYFCDTLHGRIMHGRYNARTARVDHIELFAHLDPPGTPDGATIDRHGRLWSAQWGAGRIVCFDTSGRETQRIDVPTRNPTCLAFGGPQLNVAYITTAREDLTRDQLDADASAGGLFSVDLGIGVGLPECRFDDR